MQIVDITDNFYTFRRETGQKVTFAVSEIEFMYGELVAKRKFDAVSHYIPLIDAFNLEALRGMDMRGQFDHLLVLFPELRDQSVGIRGAIVSQLRERFTK